MVATIVRQTDVAIEGARIARRVAAGTHAASTAREEMAAIGHCGDAHREQLVTILLNSLTTPIDREDLFRLSRWIDDVLDDLRDFVRESDLYGLDEQPSVVPAIDAVIDGLRALRDAVEQINQRSAEIGLAALAVKKAGNRVRRLYQLELAALFDDPLDIELMKRRELLRRIDLVGVRLGYAAAALADGVMKRSR